MTETKKKTEQRALEYKALREARGTQEEVAARLGVSSVTLSNRENANWKISEEAFAAMRALSPKPVEKKVA